jgi:rubrerythrin
MLMRNGYEQEADVVRDIQQQEMKHKDQFQAILGKVRRDTS